MRAILIGSAAYRDNYKDVDILADQEFLSTIPEIPTEVIDGRWGRTTVFKDFRGTILEVTVPNPNTAWDYVIEAFGEYATPKEIIGLSVKAAPLVALACLKKAHLTHKHGWGKHIQSYGEIKDLLGVKTFEPKNYGFIPETLYMRHGSEIKELTKKTPNLNVTKEEFFPDTDYEVFVHDTIHLSLCHPKVHAYTLMKDGEVWCSRNKWDAMPEEEKIRCVVEEAAVLALERSVIPALWLGRAYRGAEWAYKMALEKCATGITGGFFTRYLIENYREALANRIDFVAKFFDGIKSGIVQPKRLDVVNGTAKVSV